MSSSSPEIAVIVCTHNRARYLGRALSSVLAQDIPESRYEVLVVDNASRDDTAQVIAGFGSRVRGIFEPRIGLSHARNTGWRAARAPFIALLDDDAVAEPDWLRHLLLAFRNITPTPAAVGGRVTPDWETPRPAWLSDRLVLSLTVADWTDEPHAVTDLRYEWLVGANLAFSRATLEQLRGFPTELGRRGSRLLSGEETVVQQRILQRGETCWYEPRARVTHAVPVERVQQSWFRRRQFAQGVSDGTIWRLEHAREPRVAWRRALQEWRALAKSAPTLFDLRRHIAQADEFERHCGALWQWGFVRGLLGAA